MSAWNHLPNAALIDRILEDLSKHPWMWAKAFMLDCDKHVHFLAGQKARELIKAVNRVEIRSILYDKSWEIASLDIESGNWTEIGAPAWDASREAINAVLAWDDCGEILSMPFEQIQTLAVLGHNPSILLLPAARVLVAQELMK